MTLEFEKKEKVVEYCTSKSKYVYHYTGFDTIFALLYGYRKSGDYLPFRASNIYSFNDTCEMQKGFDAIKEILPKLEERGRIPIGKRLSEVYNNTEYENECKRNYRYGKGLYEVSHGIIPYVISFSKYKDFLPMWSLYGRQGKGVCLQFDLLELLEGLRDFSCCDWVHYKRTNTMSFERNVSVLYQLYLNHCDETNSAASIQSKIFELATICLALSPFFKHKDYMYEGEFRLTYYKSYINEIVLQKQPFVEQKKAIVPFINVMLPVSALKGIIIGPDANYDVMSYVLETELVDCKLDPRIITHSNIHFKQNK